MKRTPDKGYTIVQKVLWIISGSEISALKKCPNEYNRHANIGFMILMTSVFAALTSYVAGITFVKDNQLGVIAFSLIWALLIFALDRSMVNSIKKNPNAADSFSWSFFWPRLVLAIILSFFMSIPLDHIVFEERIKYQMDLNINSDWQNRQKELTSVYNIQSDSTALSRFDVRAQLLDSVLSGGCSNCPIDEYINSKAEADLIKRNELPSLEAIKTKSEREFNNHFSELRRLQSPNEDSLINSRSVIWDDKLSNLYRVRERSRQNYFNRKNETETLYRKANAACENWKNEKSIEKQKAIENRDNTEARLDTNSTIISNKSIEYQQMLNDLQGFDTQFVTLFLMPNWGVQILKWLIFLALLVIEILPTYLKLKTPIGQYDWEMHTREKESEIESKAKIAGLKGAIEEIEDYRFKNEVELNKKLIDKIVVVEEKLANEMLDEWEAKARIQIENDINKKA